MSHPTIPSPAPRGWLILAAIALVSYAVFLSRHTTIAAGGSDSSGYLNSGRALASGELQLPLRAPPGLGPPALPREAFHPWGYSPYLGGDTALTPTYPTGLPLHFAVAGKLLGWPRGPAFIELAGALAALILIYATGRELGLDWRLAAAGSAILAAFPPLIFSSIQPLSDTVATTWCLAAVYAALRGRNGNGPGWAVVCGAATGVAVLVRPTNAVLLPALVVVLGLHWRQLLLAALGGLPALAWMAFYNRTLYGGALKTGYGEIENAFALSYGWPTLQHFALWSARFIPVVLLVLPLVALFRRTTRSRELLALALWFSAITGVYAFYAISHEDWSCLRFILPGIPAVILAGMLGIQAIAPALRPATQPIFYTIAAVVLASWAGIASRHWSRQLNLYFIPGYERDYADACAAAEKHFPANAIIVCSQTSGSLYYNTRFPVLRWNFVQPEEFARYAAQAKSASVPICALLFEFETKEALQERCRGEWEKILVLRDKSLWRLVSAAPPAQAPAAR